MKIPQRILILGSTGSIGENTLKVIGCHPNYFSVSGLSANKRMRRLAEQAAFHKVNFVIVPNSIAEKEFTRAWMEFSKPIPEIYIGEKNLIESASDSSSDTIVNAIVGVAGLPASMAAAHSSKRILLANKETIVSAGEIFIQAVRGSGAELLPIDSEHNAILQCMQYKRGCYGKNPFCDVKQLLLTASGGPFLNFKPDALENISARQACLHPNWKMGKKISVDSSTMMNKGFEVIEAYWLFLMPIDKIRVVIHPQSIIHSMVEYIDGSILAQLSCPDMRIPISYALGFPETRLESQAKFLDLVQLGQLNFENVRIKQFPCFSLSLQALRSGQSACTVLSAANEIAVENFLAGRLKYISIPHVIESCLEWHARQINNKVSNLDDVLVLDKCTRNFAKNLLCK